MSRLHFMADDNKRYSTARGIRDQPIQHQLGNLNLSDLAALNLAVTLWSGNNWS